MNPYKTLPVKAFWKPAVAARSMFDVDELWDPKFHIQPNDPVVTFGSCFAQHIGRALRDRGFTWHIADPPPHRMSERTCLEFNYRVFSARTGNIYTTSLLKQWIDWVHAPKKIPDEIWVENNRFIDPFRPRIEPNGFASETELHQGRQHAVAALKNCIINAKYFVFTLGLTESWVNQKRGYEYPMCPGTAAGTFCETEHKFENQTFDTIRKNLAASISLIQKLNPKIRFILTVSPVPLTATNSGRHVLVATMASKSILRAVADQIATNRPNVDYFPSYEIINSPVFRGTFFDPNQRTVNPRGVEQVMEHFFNCLEAKFGPYEHSVNAPVKSVEEEVCEEELLAAFGENSNE